MKEYKIHYVHRRGIIENSKCGEYKPPSEVEKWGIRPGCSGCVVYFRRFIIIIRLICDVKAQLDDVLRSQRTYRQLLLHTGNRYIGDMGCAANMFIQFHGPVIIYVFLYFSFDFRGPDSKSKIIAFGEYARSAWIFFLPPHSSLCPPFVELETVAYTFLNILSLVNYSRGERWEVVFFCDNNVALLSRTMDFIFNGDILLSGTETPL